MDGNESPRASIVTKPISFEEVLTDCCRDGQFEAGILVSDEGLPIATVIPTRDPEVTAAMVALLKDVVDRVQTQLRLGRIDEVSTIDDNKVRIVCRYFTVKDNEFILAVVTAPSQSYRRVTNKAIREIKRIWMAQL